MSENNANINYKDFENICRTCLDNCKVKFFQDDVISSVFYKLTNVHFQANDDLPQQICLKCFEKINQIHEFLLQCNQSESCLMKCLNNIKKSQLNNDLEFVASSDKEQLRDLEIKLEDNITIDENIIKFEEDVKLESKNISYNELEETKVISENSYNSDEYILPDTREINDQILNCPEVKTEEQSNSNSIENDLNEDINSSNNSLSSNRASNPDDGKIHKNERSYKCENCSKSFKKSHDLKRHKLTHTGERPFVCNQCSKSFNLRSTLVTHMRTHSSERLYKCKQCPRTFDKLYYLNAHMRVHGDERPFKCEFCSKSFKFSTSCIRHMRTHSGELPFKCDQCSKTFSGSAHLKIHMRNYCGKRPFKCKVCSKSFLQSCNLKHHMDAHSDKRHECTSCNKSFNHLRSLKTHILKKHTSNTSDN